MQNGLFILDVSTAVSQAADVQKADANILFENPGTGDLLIKVLDLNLEKIEVLDMKGSLSWQARVGDQVFMVPDVAFPVSGIYFLRFKSIDGKWHSRKYMHVK